MSRKQLRYEHPAPGDLLHLDVKKLARIPDGGGHRVHGRSSETPRARGSGLDYLHVAVDDHSRYAYVEALPARSELCCLPAARAEPLPRPHPRAPRAHRQRQGHRLPQLPRRGRRRDRLRRPYAANGKAERFIQTLQNEWAYARPYLQRRTPARAPALALSLQCSPTARRHRRDCPRLMGSDQFSRGWDTDPCQPVSSRSSRGFWTASVRPSPGIPGVPQHSWGVVPSSTVPLGRRWDSPTGSASNDSAKEDGQMALYVGDDWARRPSHGRSVSASPPGGCPRASRASPRCTNWSQHASDPGEVVVGIETDRGPWVSALLAAGTASDQPALALPRAPPRRRRSDAGDAAGAHRPPAPPAGRRRQRRSAQCALARAHQQLVWDRTRQTGYATPSGSTSRSAGGLPQPRPRRRRGRAGTCERPARGSTSQIRSALRRVVASATSSGAPPRSAMRWLPAARGAGRSEPGVRATRGRRADRRIELEAELADGRRHLPFPARSRCGPRRPGARRVRGRRTLRLGAPAGTTPVPSLTVASGRKRSP